MKRKKTEPPFLKEGDKVAIVSPSWAIDEDKIQNAVQLLESWGLKVCTGDNVLKRSGPFAGTDIERLSDIQQATDDTEVKAVFCSRGGYGMLRIIGSIDFSALSHSPKWYIGFSDVTVLHLWLNEVCGLVSVHGEMPLHYSGSGRSEETFNTLKDALTGRYGSLTWEGDIIRPASATGEVTGGNLSLIYSLMGTKAEPDTSKKILFIEEVGEYYYHLDRMLNSLKLAGKLKDLSALVIGGLTDMEDTKVPWGRTAAEIISEAVLEYDYPVFFGFPAGHINDNRAFYLGKKAIITPLDEMAELRYV